jgi:hypothetical protein
MEEETESSAEHACGEARAAEENCERRPKKNFVRMHFVVA